MSALYADPLKLWARLLRRVERTESGCWQFIGATNSRGYGIVCSGRKGKNVLTHRLAVIVRDGSIPDGMTVDHQCHDSLTCRADVDCPHRRCVNPAHLAVMTLAENTARRWEAGLCAKGHPLTRRTTGQRRQRECLVCRSEYLTTYTAARVAAAGLVVTPGALALTP